ncbi:DUF805 domain-containing protein [Albimonas sp. CAU 1670]|uniref:DUF805 domain-containing protein n=1 Tax=Albimonas sp. CAU 1670 TaxID=3032599 RepID=UPI0023DB4368|nr:DUF805 domain-containing protein [Albimonas sp. CAU 1670]MDF2231089.1 DUF805 domain-containing protein [Albimonas sp. CAU 1670]
MTFDQSISTCFRKYVTFSGRAPRSELWWFALFVVVISWLLGFIEVRLLPGMVNLESGVGPLTSAWSLVTLLPGISVAVRRLHDGNRSGWWWWLWLIPLIGSIVLLVWFVLKGTSGANDYGPDPLAPPSPPSDRPWEIPAVGKPPA